MNGCMAWVSKNVKIDFTLISKVKSLHHWATNPAPFPNGKESRSANRLIINLTLVQIHYLLIRNHRIMKLLLPLFLLLTQISLAVPYFADPETTLFDKVSEVNKEWLTKDWDNPVLTANPVFESDEAVIQTHLFLVERYLRAHTPEGLTPSQLAKRNATLNILNQYAQRGLFPKNTNHDHRQPYFIDRYGTACAVGYLIIETGYADLANRVAKEMNYAYIREIPYPELLDWAQEYGFTVDELAWIQPGYASPATFPYNSTGTGIDGTVNTMIVDPVADVLYVGGLFETSTPQAQNLLTFNGNSWTAIGQPNGEVKNIQVVNGDIWVMGAFDSISGLETGPIASWDGQNWIPLGLGLQGSVKQVLAYDGAWYAAGEFTGFVQHTYLAKKIFNQNWTMAPWEFGGPVESMVEFDQRLILGGYFQTVDGDTIEHMAFYDGATISADTAPGQPVTALIASEGELFVGTDIIYENEYPQWTPLFFKAIKYQSSGHWYFDTPYYGFTQIDTSDPFVVSRIQRDDNGLLISGNFWCAHMYGHAGKNAVLEESATLGHALAYEINGPINTAISYKGKYYIGGAFDSVNSSVIAAMAYTEADIIAGIDPESTRDYYRLLSGVSDYTFEYSKSGEPPHRHAQVLNLNGQLVTTLEPAGSSFTWHTGNLPKGMYLVKLPVEEDQFAVQKVVVK